MTPEDKELTGRAALAAGIRVEWQEAHQCFWIAFGQGIEVRPWVPLDDDGQSLRLANRLRLSITMYNEGLTTRHFSQVTRTLGSELGREDSATRRAIVTAAAAMWLDHVDEMDRDEIENPKEIVSVTVTDGAPMTATLRDGTVIDVAAGRPAEAQLTRG